MAGGTQDVVNGDHVLTNCLECFEVTSLVAVGREAPDLYVCKRLNTSLGYGTSGHIKPDGRCPLQRRSQDVAVPSVEEEM